MDNAMMGGINNDNQDIQKEGSGKDENGFNQADSIPNTAQIETKG
jgi:hypothetical protein